MLLTSGNVGESDVDVFDRLFPNHGFSTFLQDTMQMEKEPLDIIYDSAFNIVETFSKYVNTYGLIALIQQMIWYGALISVLVSLIALLFVKNADMIKEKKTDITYKVGLALASSAAAFILNVVKSFFDELFGMI